MITCTVSLFQSAAGWTGDSGEFSCPFLLGGSDEQWDAYGRTGFFFILGEDRELNSKEPLMLKGLSSKKTQNSKTAVQIPYVHKVEIRAVNSL